MSVQATTWVWDHSQAQGTARLVLLAIADAANREGRRSYQSASTIARMVRCSPRTVQRVIDGLIQSGELVREDVRGAHGTMSYSIPISRPRYDTATTYDTDDVRHLDTPATTSGVPSYDIAMSPEPITPSTPVRRPRRSAEHPLPDTWEPTDAHRSKAAEKNLNLAYEAEQFRLHADTHGRTAVNWNSAFSMWLNKATPRQQTIPTGRPSQGSWMAPRKAA